MADIVAIPIPTPYVGSVNVWLLRGDPLTLVDTGPANDRALSALERGLREHGVRLDDVEQVLATHHHLDHVGWRAPFSSGRAPPWPCRAASRITAPTMRTESGRSAFLECR